MTGVFCEFRPAGEFCGWFCFVSDECVDDAFSMIVLFLWVCSVGGAVALLLVASVSDKVCGFVTF